MSTVVNPGTWHEYQPQRNVHDMTPEFVRGWLERANIELKHPLKDVDVVRAAATELSSTHWRQLRAHLRFCRHRERNGKFWLKGGSNDPTQSG